VRVPTTKAEQTAIAVILSDMDADAAALETKLPKARHGVPQLRLFVSSCPPSVDSSLRAIAAAPCGS
jgi:hypothetical protein